MAGGTLCQNIDTEGDNILQGSEHSLQSVPTCNNVEISGKQNVLAVMRG